MMGERIGLVLLCVIAATTACDGRDPLVHDAAVPALTDGGVGPADVQDVDAAVVDAPGVDAPPPPPPIPSPPACTFGGTVPALPTICISGWCIDAPVPLAYAASTLVDGAALWISLPGFEIRISGGQATTSYANLLGDPGARLSGGGSRGLWAVTGDQIARYDSGSWTRIARNFPVSAFDANAPDDAWALVGGQLQHYDGSTWSVETMPPQLTNAAGYSVWLDGIHASSASELWVVGDAMDSSFHFYYWVAHRDVNGWTVHAAPERLTSVWPVGPTDVWLAGERIYHFDGTTLQALPIAGGDLTGTAADDVWAVQDAGSGISIVSHWDGQTWSSCKMPRLMSIAPRGPGDVWGTHEDGTLAHFDGVAWASTHTLEPINDLAAIPTATGQDMFAIGNGASGGVVLRRDSTGTWNADTTFPGTASTGLRGRATNDLWAFGPGAVHFDGTTWRDTIPTSSIRDLCVSDGLTAIAASADGLHFYDGTAWTLEASLGLVESVACFPGGEAWARVGVYQVAHRSGGTWSWTLETEGLGASYSPGPGILWTFNDGISRTSGPAWERDPSLDVGPLMPPATSNPMFLSMTATSPSNIYVLVEIYTDPVTVAQRVLRYDGTAFVQATPVSNVRAIHANGVDDLFLIHADFSIDRMVNGVVQSFSGPAAADHIGFGGGTTSFLSTTRAFGVSDEGHLMRFDGSSWTRDLSFPALYARAPLAFAANDVWAIADPGGVAHYDGTQWTVTPLPSIATGDMAIGMWGSSSNDLWVVSTGGLIWRVVGGVPQLFDPALAASERPHAFESVAGTGPNDIWFSARLLTQYQYQMALYHWDGSTFTRYRTLRSLNYIAMIDGELLASAWDAHENKALMWQYATDHWIVRPDLDPATVFPWVPYSARPLFQNSLIVQTASGPLYATGGPNPLYGVGGMIWRRP